MPHSFHHGSPDHSTHQGVLSRATPRNYEEAGVCSPPLWRNNYRSLSPSSKAQAIAKGQRELMDLVSRMPEGCYELSLKDIVEQQQQQPVEEVKQESSGKEKKMTDKSRKLQLNRSGSVDNGGFLLKMVFPVTWGPRRRQVRSNNSGTNTNPKDGRLSPKPLLFDAEKEWWKKGFPEEEVGTESGGSGSRGGSSKGSGGGSSSSRSGGCWSFIFCRTAKAAG